MLAANPLVLVLDFTYYSNKICLQLFRIVGMTASNSTLFVAFTFLKQAEKADSVWVPE
jgi:hypothetical protein